MLPLLTFLADGEEHSSGEALDAVASHFKLTEAERAELLPSGMQAKISNRVAWAKTYMGKAGLLRATRRGWFHITDRGQELLSTAPTAINLKTLRAFPEFVEFHGVGQKSRLALQDGPELESALVQQTPQETLENSFQALHRQLAQELLEKISEATPRFFERLVVDLLVSMGYGGSRKDAGQAIGRIGDEGIDGIIKEDRLGLDAVYIQAKRWKSTVGRPDVQAFAGSLEGHRARKGVFITTSQFSPEARDYVGRIEKKIILIDGQQLANLAVEFEVGVAEVTTYSVKKLDLDYFEEE